MVITQRKYSFTPNASLAKPMWQTRMWRFANPNPNLTLVILDRIWLKDHPNDTNPWIELTLTKIELQGKGAQELIYTWLSSFFIDVEL